eukprot:COSAG05_NODE_1682_length_4285_cov_33.861682_2_plen_75_part_00
MFSLQVRQDVLDAAERKHEEEVEQLAAAHAVTLEKLVVKTEAWADAITEVKQSQAAIMIITLTLSSPHRAQISR